jgi:IMP dehydrogenase
VTIRSAEFPSSINSAGKLKGILTNRDLRFEKDMKKKVHQAMTKDNLIVSIGATSLSKGRVDSYNDTKLRKLTCS